MKTVILILISVSYFGIRILPGCASSGGEYKNPGCSYLWDNLSWGNSEAKCFEFCGENFRLTHFNKRQCEGSSIYAEK